jgi:hypothetical protein
MSINKNGQPKTSEPIVFESTNGSKGFGARRAADTGTMIFNSKSANVRYFEQTQGLQNIEPIPGSKGSRGGGVRTDKRSTS